MILLAALLLYSSPPPEKETLQPVVIAPGKYRNLTIRVDQVPYRVQAEFRVLEHGPRVRALLLTAGEAAKYLRKETFRAEYSTAYEREGFLGCWLTRPGEYEFILDNRIEPRQSARVELSIGYARGTPHEKTRILPVETRRRVVAFSLLLFACIAGPAGYAVIRSFRRASPPPA